MIRGMVLIQSLVRWNAETFNIYTMLLGCAVSMYIFARFPKTISSLCVLLTCLAHNPYSVRYHMYTSLYGHDWSKWKDDVCAIFTGSVWLTLAMALSTFPVPLALMYTTFAACVATTFKEQYTGLADADLERLDYYKHSMRIGVIIMVYCAPMLFGGMRRIWYLVYVIVSLGIGGAVYANKVPESFGFGKTLGNSNHIMHVCIIVAHVCHYFYVREKTSEGA